MTLSYNGYTGSIQHCTIDNIYFGKLLHIEDLVMYDASTEAELKVAFEDAVDDYLNVLDLVHKEAELFKQ